jgi:DNA-binding NarL/FixJ family response regulator
MPGILARGCFAHVLLPSLVVLATIAVEATVSAGRECQQGPIGRGSPHAAPRWRKFSGQGMRTQTECERYTGKSRRKIGNFRNSFNWASGWRNFIDLALHGSGSTVKGRDMSMHGSVRVLMADDHEGMGRGLCGMIEEAGFELCGEAGSGREAVRLALQLAPDVAVLNLATADGVEATRQIRSCLKTEVLLFDRHGGAEAVRQALRAGARGYLLNGEAADHLAQAIDALSRHRPFFTASVSEAILAAYTGSGTGSTLDAPPREGLTMREREVLRLLAEGRTNKSVALALGISAKTVETHRATIKRKLNAPSFAALVRYAVRNGLAAL